MYFQISTIDAVEWERINFVTGHLKIKWTLFSEIFVHIGQINAKQNGVLCLKSYHQLHLQIIGRISQTTRGENNNPEQMQRVKNATNAQNS